MTATKTNTHCATCHREFRKRVESIAGRPGTVAYGGMGLCNGCRYRNNAGLQGAPTSSPYKGATNGKCESCGRQMRHTRRRLADYPGTVPYGSGGLCGSCWKRERKASTGGRNLTINPKAPHAPALLAYMREREARKARLERIAAMQRRAS